MRFFAVLTIISVTMASVSRPAFAEDNFPSQQVRLIAPSAAGSTTDIIARVLANELSRVWKQPVIVNNLSGAAMSIGSSVAARSAPDGYTLLLVPPNPLVVNQFIYPNIGYEPDKLTAVSLLVSAPDVLDVRPDFPASTFQEFVAYARANPGKVTYASPGAGSMMQLYSVDLGNRTGTRMVHVPYSGGTAPALVDLMAGHIDSLFDVIATSRPVVENKQVKALAIGGKTRSPSLPDVPTFDELGFPGFEASTWFALVAPPKTPPEIVDKINRDVVLALREPSVAKQLNNLSMDVIGATPAETAAFLADQRELWSGVVKKNGITIE